MPDKEPAKTEASIALSDDMQIRNMIYTVRGQQVMLDSNFAELYEVETKRLNEAVGRNKTRSKRSSVAFWYSSCLSLTVRICSNIWALSAMKCRISTKAFMILTLTFIAVWLLRTAESMATPCSVNTLGR